MYVLKKEYTEVAEIVYLVISTALRNPVLAKPLKFHKNFYDQLSNEAQMYFEEAK